MRERLLRQALESGKTTSKKNKTKQDSLASSGFASRSSSRAPSAINSRAGSAATSRTGSRVGSAAGTDDEHDSLEGFDSEDSSEQDFGQKLEYHLEEVDTWQNALETRISNILGRGKRRAEERSEDLRWYTGILQNHYASEEIQSLLPEIVRQLLRASTAEDEKEALLALKALDVTVLTDQSEDHFENCVRPLKSLIQDYGDETVKAEALHSLALVAYVSGSLVDLVSVMTFCLEIIETDGTRVLADDSAPVVAAALNALSLCCTRLPDLDPQADYLQDIDREFSQEAIESVAEQLESSYAPVQIAAGEAIALFYEKSYRKATQEDAGKLKENIHTGQLPNIIEKYNAYRNTNQLLDQLQDVNKSSSKSTAKGQRRALNETLRDVAQSIENPERGPGWRAAEGWKAAGRNNGTARGQKRGPGPSIKVKIGFESVYLVEHWWQKIRVQEFRSVLGHGFLEHFAENPVIKESLYQEFDGAETDSDEDDDEEDYEDGLDEVSKGNTKNDGANGNSRPKIAASKGRGGGKNGRRNGNS